MIRFTVIHWIPVADNMLPEIMDALLIKLKTQEIAEKPNKEGDAVLYSAQFTFEDNYGVNNAIAYGKINQRGFAQHVFEIPHITGMSLSNFLNRFIPRALKSLSEFLFDIVPLSVRNKLAVLNEGIYAFQEFESNKFEPLIDIPGKLFLRTQCVVAIIIGEKYLEDIQTGLEIPNLRLNASFVSHKGEISTIPVERVFRDDSQRYLTAISSDNKCFVFYISNFDATKRALHDDEIFKFCALVAYIQFIDRIINILKEVRDHMIPLRRQLAIKLQRNTEDHFNTLTNMKKYLTYVNIKVPVIKKVLNHAELAWKSPQFIAKLSTFEASKIANYPNINLISLHDLRPNNLRPTTLSSKIQEDMERLPKLYDEDENEVRTFSEELTYVLQGTLMSENVQILTRELDTSRAVLELDRGGKNRSNALKILSVALSANLGALIATELGLQAGPKLIAAFGLAFLAWIFTEWYIGRKAAYFRLVIPINTHAPADSLSNLTHNHALKRIDANGNRRTRTWSQMFRISDASQVNSSSMHQMSWFRRRMISYKSWQRRKYNKRRFDVTIDYEKRGYIHSIMLEAEYDFVQFGTAELVEQVISDLDRYDCLRFYREREELEETSLLANSLSHLGVFLDPELVSLNMILTSSSPELRQSLLTYKDNPEDTSISDDDRFYLHHIFEDRNLYIRWLVNLQEQPEQSKLLRLIGLTNAKRKQIIIESCTGDNTDAN